MSITKKATVLAVGLGMVGCLAACGSSSDGGSQGSGDSKTVTLVSHNSWAASKDVIAAFEKSSGYKVRVLEDGDAGQAVNKAILTRDNPPGRRLLRRRQHAAVPRARQRAVPAVRGQGLRPYPPRVPGRPGQAPGHARHHRRHLCQLRQGILQQARAGPAGLLRRPGQARVQGPARHRERGHLLARSRLPARHRRRVRGRRLAGLLEEAEGERRQGRRRLGAGVQRGVLRFVRRQEGQGRPPARRLLRLVPARRGDLRRPAARNRADGRRHRHLLPSGRVRRPAGQRREHRGRQGTPRLPHRQGVPGGHAAEHVRLPGAGGRADPRGVPEVRAAGRGPADHGPGEDRRQSRPVGQVVDLTRTK